MRFTYYKHALAFAAGAAGVVFLTGCVDDSYDLENIDTTMRFEVKDLTLPLNLAPVEFDDLIDLTSEECVAVIDGQYVIIKEGSFNSEEININRISAEPVSGEQPTPVPLPIYGSDATIPAINYDFSYTEYGVDKYIVDITGGDLDFDIKVTISANNNGMNVPCDYKNLVFGIPAGLYGYCREYPDMKISHGDVPELKFANVSAANGVFSFTYHVTHFDCKDANVDFNKDTREFHYEGNVCLKSGAVKAKAGQSGTLADIALKFELGKLEVLNFDGEVYYVVEDVDMEEIDLGDLPDVLTDPSTNIGLKNPQIYVSVSNPLYHYGVTGSIGMNIMQQRESGADNYTANLVRRLNLTNIGGIQHFCLSPTEINDFYAPFSNSKWYEMRGLGNILKGAGVPQKLLIDLETPRMEPTKVQKFALGQNLGTLEGKYTFYAPLEFTEDSRVIYTDTQHGWGLGSEEDLVITSLKLKAHVKSDLPVSVYIEATPIDEDGNVILNDDGTPVTITPAEVPAMGEKDIVIELTGTVRNIDGMIYTVRLVAGQDASALKPTMNLNLTNLKAVASGYYESVDDDDDDDDYYESDYEY